MIPLCLHQETRNNFQVNGWLFLTLVILARETIAQNIQSSLINISE